MRLFSAIVLALIAAVAIISACVAALPIEIAYRLIWSCLAFPILWTVLIFCVYWAEKPARPCILLVATSLASTAVILLR